MTMGLAAGCDSMRRAVGSPMIAVMKRWLILIALPALLAQGPKRVEGTPDWMRINTNPPGVETVGPREGRLWMRKTVKTVEHPGEKGMEASTVIEAWPAGADVREKPMYRIAVEGFDPQVVANEVLVIARGLEDVQWWSVYGLANGRHLFDTYAPLQRTGGVAGAGAIRYAGLEVPPDDAEDARLRAANVVGVLSYSSAGGVIREGLITCNDTRRARLLRSYFDSTRVLGITPHGITLVISQTAVGRQAAPASISLSVPILHDDLGLDRARVPAGLQIQAWKR